MGAKGARQVAAASVPTGLIDTDILIDVSRGFPDAVAFLSQLHATSIVRASMITAMELIVGCRNKAELRNVQSFLRTLVVLPVDESISQTAYNLMERYYLSHGLMIPDALIAATALAHGLTLFTKNTRHFQMIPSLVIIRPY